MVIIAIIISLFFVVMICMIGKAYYDDIIDIEDRLLQLEKRNVYDKQELKAIKNDIDRLWDVVCELHDKVVNLENKKRK